MIQSFKNGVNSKERIRSRMTPTEKGGKNENGRVAFLESVPIYFNPTALRKAKIVCNFGLSECSRVKQAEQAILT